MRKTKHLLYLFCLVTLVKSEWPNTCQHQQELSRSQAYYLRESHRKTTSTACGPFWAFRCTAYRSQYQSVPKYHLQYYNESYTEDCYGYCYNYECHDCRVISNCNDTRCSTSSDQQCFKCEYDRGGEKKAYSLVYSDGIQNRACEQRCSWRPDSKFCYPGSCPNSPSSCTCAVDFSGSNCLTIDSGPIIEECSAKIGQSDGAVSCDINCGNDNFVYCGVNTEMFTVDWVTSYIPAINDLNRPYYVNETGFGVVSAVLRWQLMRDQAEALSGKSTCLGEESHILNIRRDELPRRSCSHAIELSTKFLHNDRLTLRLTTRNGGYIKINNYDLPHTVTVDDAKFYSQEETEKKIEITFDFAAPQHCLGTSSDCTAKILDIGNPYTRNGDVTVTWVLSDWNDNPAGIRNYDCEAYKLTVNQAGDVLGMRAPTPHATVRNIDSSIYSVDVRLPDTGVFAIVLTVYDTVGNAAKARRFLVYDENSAIKIDPKKPIEVTESNTNVGITWLTRSKGEINLSWKGHFYNSFYRDGKFLNKIEEHDPSFGTYDEATGQPPSSRSREEISNDNGITQFQLGFVESSSDRSVPDNWIDIDKGMTSQTISILGDSNDHITVWLRAFDVMNNTMEDKTRLYIDRTQPKIGSIDIIERTSVENSASRSKRMAPAGTGIRVQTHDDESGILEVKWQVFDKTDIRRLYGEGKIDETSPNHNPNIPCNTSPCTCLKDRNVCFYLEYEVVFKMDDFPTLPKGDTECIVRVTVVNNAMLEVTSETEILLTSTRAPKTAAASTGSSTGGIAGGSVAVVVVIAIVVVAVLVVLFRRRKAKKDQNAREERPITFSGVSKEHGIDNLNYENTKGTNNYEQSAKVMNVNKPVHSKGNNSALSRGEMEFSSSKLVLKEKLNPGIHRAKATNIAVTLGDSIVVVKALKDDSSRKQREYLLHELDIMLAIVPHENIIRLMGCITQTGSPKPSIIMEFAPYGNLGGVLKRSTRESKVCAEGGEDDEDMYAYSDLFENKNAVTSEQLMLFAEQICTGMEHLSSMKIIHRKLGVRNVMVGDRKICKIASFSHAIRTDQLTVKDPLGGRLPIRWMAPESLASSEFSVKSDVWTYGIVLWEILTLGALPYPGMANKEISDHIKHGQRMAKPTHCTDEIYSLMLRCWAQKPANRPLFCEILSEIRRITKIEEVANFDEYDSELYGVVGDI